MDSNARAFIKASLIYLGLGVLLGVHVAFSDTIQFRLRFVHVHFMLLGFMAMMLYGVAYHILPRFNAKQVPYPALIRVHFWMANIGLVGLCSLYLAGAFWDDGALRSLFGLFGVIEGVAIFIFIVNIFTVLTPDEEEEEDEEEPQAQEPEAVNAPPVEDVKISPSMKIAEILDKWPGLEERMTDEGLGNVANPAVRTTIAQMVTLEMAAKQAGKDLFDLMATLEGKKLLTTDSKEPEVPAHPEGYLKNNKGIKRGEMADAKTQIGGLLEIYPEVKPVFEKHYGAACFTCPGQKTETVEQTAMMHNMPTETILDEINSAIKEAVA